MFKYTPMSAYISSASATAVDVILPADFRKEGVVVWFTSGYDVGVGTAICPSLLVYKESELQNETSLKTGAKPEATFVLPSKGSDAIPLPADIAAIRISLPGGGAASLNARVESQVQVP